MEVVFLQSRYALGLKFRSFRVLQKLECNQMFVLCILQHSLLSLSAQCAHTHGFRLLLFSLSTFNYHLEFDISIIFIYLNGKVHTL